ncbi:hypothetical protein Poly30_35630 [Planctomycetes bacterium Poly30]|uniref:Uncharacterized protein n=2 Tax=Saltatorellus ferox TaxID=2528018 RepID=A0A518EVB3_9BACT|nr:hypothetical protein Poly30_35630 [Planctomycetes bacterium Poly30]
MHPQPSRWRPETKGLSGESMLARQDHRVSSVETFEVPGSGQQVFVDLSLPRRPVVTELRAFVDFEPVVDEHPEATNAASLYLLDADSGH